jgi:tRNA A-37 threonylcarbamoyl transferase component Bud32
VEAIFLTEQGEYPGEFQAGDVVGENYLVLNYLGRGAMGHVYHVRHQMLNTEYALKTLSGEHVTDLAWRRFQNEAHAIARLHHRNLVSIYNLGLHKDTLPYYVMDYLVGCDLSERIKLSGALEPKEAIEIFIEVCAGISYAHRQGIVHRDIKPGNIFLLAKPGSSGEKVKVVDFGIAKLSYTDDAKNQALTAIGDVVGTPFYMSPEQCMGQRVDARSDIYSLGCTMFEALTGSLPFRASSPTATMLLHQSAPPPSLNKGSLGKDFPDDLEYILATTLAKEPSERYQTVDQLSKDLAAVIGGDRHVAVTAGGATIVTAQQPASLNLKAIKEVPTKKWGLVVAPLVAVLCAIAGFTYWQSKSEVKRAPKVALTEELKNFSPQLYEHTAEDKLADTEIVEETYGPDPDDLPPAKLPTNQIVTVSLLMKKPFSHIETEAGESTRVFDFPSDVALGLLQSRRLRHELLAQGQLKVPAKARVNFVPSGIVGRYPECLKRFQPDDIFCVNFDPKFCDAQIVKAAQNIPGVKKIAVRNCNDLTAAAIGNLKGFPHITAFDCTDSKLDGRLLAQAGCWANIEELNLHSTRNVLPMLQALRKSPELKFLGLSKCKLTPQDFQAIAELPQIERLDLGWTTVTANELALLTKLTNLTELKLQCTGLDGSSLETVKNFKSLTMLDYFCNKTTYNQLLAIKGLDKIKEIRLANTGLDGSALKIISHFKALNCLEFSNNKVTNKDLSALIILDKLKELRLEECGLDESAAEILKKIPSLEKLKIKSKDWTGSQVDKVKETLPSVKVT